ncbi:hypothetical protein [Sphingobacterium sp. PCS056]|nr:hypothetical protein [Sphingobacterium sp. PCS056]
MNIAPKGYGFCNLDKGTYLDFLFVDQNEEGTVRLAITYIVG